MTMRAVETELSCNALKLLAGGWWFLVVFFAYVVHVNVFAAT